MGRPERPLDPDAGPLQRFAHELRQLRAGAPRLSYRELSRRAHYSVTALSEAAGGGIFPTLAVTLAYVEACGGDTETWEKLWREVAAELAAADAGAEAQMDQNAPYLGLVTFDPDDADRFFGRRELVNELSARLRDTSLLAVFGASGSGKSSLLRAGLLPALRNSAASEGRDRPTLLLTPGAHPLDELAVGLANLSGISAPSLYADLVATPSNVRLAIGQILAGRPKSARIVIVVDQFEEVFSLCDDQRERSLFLDSLIAAAEETNDRARVVLGIRADFYARCAEHPPLVAMLRDRHLLIGPMEDDDLRQVIIGPALRAELKVERALVETILSDARGEPGALPLISHALLETWKRRKGGTLTLAGYREAGGIQGAIAQTAEQIYDGLDAGERGLARNAFLRLTALGQGTEDTRRRVPPAELLAGPDGAAMEAVLSRLTAARLLTVDEDSVQVAHEAVIRSWPRLRGWLAEDRELVRLQRRLTDAATEWEQHGREDELLYRGTRLAAWEDRALDRLNDLEHAFLAAGRARARRERAAAGRRVRAALISLVVVATVVGVLAVMALVNADRAEEERDLAYSRQLAADARGQLQLDPQLGLLLARRAYAVSPTEEATAVLRQATVDSRIRLIVPIAAGKVCGVAFSPDGRQLAAGSGDGTVRVWRVSAQGLPTGDPVVLHGHAGEAWNPVFSPDGRYLATGGIDGTVSVSDWAGGGDPLVLRGHRGPVWGVSFNPDGQRLASAGDDGTVRIWKAPDGGRWTGGSSAGGDAPKVLRGHDGRALQVVFSPDGRRLASSGGDGTVRIWDPAGKAKTVVLRGHENSVEGLQYSPDGRNLVSGSTDGTVRVWDVTGQNAPAVLRGHDGTVEGTAVSRDSRRIASVGNDGTVRIWNMASNIDPLVLRGHRGTTWSASFSPDGRTLASASDDGTMRLWDVAYTGDAMILRGHTGGTVYDAAFGPDGRRVASAGVDGTIRVQNIDGSGDALVLRGHKADVLGVAFSPDGRRLASTGADSTVRIWHADGSGQAVVLRGHSGHVWNAAFSPDGTRVVSGGDDGTVRVWHTDGTGAPVVMDSPQSQVRYVGFSPDGRRVASAGVDGTILIQNADGTGQPVMLRGHQGLVWCLAFSPDGRRLVSGGNDGTIRIWNTDGTGDPIVLRGHQGVVWSVGFSPDGRQVISSGNDHTVRIWMPAEGGEPVVFSGSGTTVNSVKFSPDGWRLLSTYDDATVRIWRCEVCGSMHQVQALAAKRTIRELTPEERKIYLEPSP
ncbi:hypothetical protein ACGFNP_44660 [Nonomuraea sp. NPDC049269]|uniref:nSTAND1 domain-containing NTPase n=1 Tax=Nonomuraea sp. NPDC049269 TaxID=3364349 RepID=UPI003717F4F7